MEKKGRLKGSTKFKLGLLSHFHTDGELREVGVIMWLLVLESYMNCQTQSTHFRHL